MADLISPLAGESRLVPATRRNAEASRGALQLPGGRRPHQPGHDPGRPGHQPRLGQLSPTGSVRPYHHHPINAYPTEFVFF